MTDGEVIFPGELQPESRFFQPTGRCRNPERWHSTDGDSTEREVAEFIGALVRVCQPEVVVELGTAFGETAEFIVDALTRNGHGYLYTLETDPERVQHVRDRIPAAANWEIIQASSLEWEPPPGTVIDVLFSDTLRDLRCEEIHRFLPYMCQAGLAAVHDSGWDVGPLRGWLENSLVKPGLARAVDFPTPRGLTLLELKPGDGL